MNRGLLATIIVCLAVFLTGKLVGEAMIAALALPSGPGALAARPWSALSYMFCHGHLGHFAVNMAILAIYCLATASVERSWLSGTSFIIGGLAGAAIFELVIDSPGDCLLGASAAVMGVAGCSLVAWPRLRLAIFADRSIPLWIITLALIAATAIECVWLPTGTNASHAAGLVAGLLTGLILMPRRAKVRPDRMDPLLKKAKTSGYSSLSRDEQKELFTLTSGANGDAK